jgi:hypothetical protein
MPAPKYHQKNKLGPKETAQLEKQKIEQMQDIIKDKLKDSESLKKAAQIIEELLQDDAKKIKIKKKTGS